MTTAVKLSELINGNNNQIVVPSGGIQFADATNANTVANQSNLIEQDGYEEGTWTPTISLGVTSITYDKQEGTYTKVGDIVTVSCTLAITAGTANGNTFRIGGFPFTSYNLTDYAFVGIVKANTVSYQGDVLIVFMVPNDSKAYLNVRTSTSTGAFSGFGFSTSGSISFSLTYKTT